MKTLFLILFVCISSLAFGQVQIDNNPYSPEEKGVTRTTDVTLYLLPSNAAWKTTVIIKRKSDNASTIKFSATSSTAITSSPAYAAGDQLILEVTGGRFWVDFGNANDDFYISW